MRKDLMIKYLGSKRRLVGLIGDLYALTPSNTAADVFAGTTRVGQELKRRGAYVHSIHCPTDDNSAHFASHVSPCTFS